MPAVFGAIFVGIEIVAGLATILSVILPIINQYIYKQEPDPKVKVRQRKITLITFGVALLSAACVFGIGSTLQESSNATSQIRGRILSHLNSSNEAGNMTALAWSPDGTRIASTDDRGTIQVWDALTANRLLTYQPPSWSVTSLSWSPDGKYLAVNVDSRLYILEVDNTLLRLVFTLNSPSIVYRQGAIAWSPDGTRIAIAYYDDAIRVWNVIAGHLISNQKPLIYMQHSAEAYALAWSPDAQYIASANNDQTVRIWDSSKSNKIYRTIHDTSSKTALYSNLAWSPQGNWLATENGDGIVSAWSYKTGDEVFHINTHPSISSRDFLPTGGGAVAWSPDGQSLAIGAFDGNFNGKIRVLVMPTGSEDIDFTDNTISGPIYSLAWSPNGDYIAAAPGFSSGIVVWQARGVPTLFLAQVLQEDQDPWWWSLLKAEGISIGIALGGIVICWSWIGKQILTEMRSKKTKLSTFLFLLINIVLFILTAVLGITLSTYLIRAGITSTELALVLGFILLMSLILPLTITGCILPSRRRGQARKRSLSYIKHGKEHEKQGKYQRAIDDYDRAIALDPSNRSAYIERGDIYTKQKEYQWAIEDYDHALSLGRSSAYVYYKRGLTYFSLKKYQEAVENYTRAAELSPNEADIYCSRGLAYVWLKNVPQARIDYIHSHDLNPKDIDSAWKAAWIGMSKQRVDQETAEYLEQIAVFDPEHYTALVCRGVALGLRNKVKEGLKEVEKAIPLAPKNWDAYYWKGMLFTYYYGGKPRVEEAKEMIEQAIAMGLPPVLLTPLYWLEKDRPAEFLKYAQPLLLHYNV